MYVDELKALSNVRFAHAEECLNDAKMLLKEATKVQQTELIMQSSML